MEVKHNHVCRFKGRKIWFDELNMPLAEKAAKDRKVVIIPCGSIEEHGTHLPLNTDSLQAEYIALNRSC